MTSIIRAIDVYRPLTAEVTAVLTACDRLNRLIHSITGEHIGQAHIDDARAALGRAYDDLASAWTDATADEKAGNTGETVVLDLTTMKRVTDILGHMSPGPGFEGVWEYLHDNVRGVRTPPPARRRT